MLSQLANKSQNWWTITEMLVSFLFTKRELKMDTNSPIYVDGL